MAIIIETCPECGHDLTNITLTMYPPIPQKKCFACGWEWTQRQGEEIIRVPFRADKAGRSNLDKTEIKEISSISLKDSATGFIPNACKNCPTHPSNGGSGICNCTLGVMNITY